MSKKKQYTVIRDTREKEGHGWIFPESEQCLGTTVQKLDTGDYSLLGYEKIFCIERKESITEFANNITEPRFERELERIDDTFLFAYMFLEFYIDDIFLYPSTANIPKYMMDKIQVSPKYLMRRFNEIQVKHKVKMLFVGPFGRDTASSLFKRIVEHHG